VQSPANGVAASHAPVAMIPGTDRRRRPDGGGPVLDITLDMSQGATSLDEWEYLTSSWLMWRA
jgi:hypothetical protein